MSRDKMVTQTSVATKAVTPFTTATGKHGPRTKSEIIHNQSDRQNLMTIIPKEALGALLTQPTRVYESATLVPLSRTGSSLFSGAGSHSHAQSRGLRS